MRRRIILFELNEVPFRVLDDYCRRHPNSVIGRALSDCSQYETVAPDSILSPWVTWPTLHRGVSDRSHLIHHMGQDLSNADREYPPIWKILAASGVKTGLFGSLHSHPLPDRLDGYAYYVPDTFAPSVETHPVDLARFQAFNLRMARESPRNVSPSLPVGAAMQLLAHAGSLGLRPATLADVSLQLAQERLWPWRRVRRRTYQTVLAFDVFMKQLARSRPEFTTFHTNHVASAMHRYWAAAFPEDYLELRYNGAWIRRYSREIEFAMAKLDGSLGRLLRFVEGDPEYQIWIASSMGQQAQDGDPLERQLYLRDTPRFMGALGFEPAEWSARPAMVPDVSVYVREDRAAAFRAALSSVRIAGSPLEFDEREGGFFHLHFGHQDLDETEATAAVLGRDVPLEHLGLANVRIEDRAGQSAYHSADGLLLIYDPRRRAPAGARATIFTTQIAPALLANFSLTPPGYMPPAERLA